MLEAAARDERAGLDQRLDDGVVGVAFLALVVEDALALEAGRLRGERAVFVDGVGDAGFDPAFGQRLSARHPDVEILAAVARRRVDEARAGIVGDVVAVEQRDDEVVASFGERMGDNQRGEFVGRDVAHEFEAFDLRGGEDRLRERFGEDVSRADLGPVAVRRTGHAIGAVGDAMRE